TTRRTKRASTRRPPFANTAYARVISSSVNGYDPSASDRLGSSAARTPRSRASSITCSTPTSRISRIVALLTERASDSRSVIGPQNLRQLVLGPPGLPRAVLHHHRRVVHDRGRRPASPERRRVNEGLEGRAGLALGLHGAIELALGEVLSAHQRLHVAALHLEREQRALGGG